jgi:hypothetical protein
VAHVANLRRLIGQRLREEAAQLRIRFDRDKPMAVTGEPDRLGALPGADVEDVPSALSVSQYRRIRLRCR